MSPARRNSAWIGSVCLVVVSALGCAACGQANPVKSAIVTVSPKPSNSPVPPASGPLKAPHTSITQDGQFLTDITEADPSLVTYERQQGNVALRALLTDGSAFCSLLQRGGGIDNALVSVAVGARSDEPQTHLPLSVTTFNSIESVALLTLCPSDLKLLPGPDRNKIHNLGAALASRTG
ncbi:MAG: hypothetical protein ACLP6E_19740 [Acidimicrobiales bacterium]